MYMNETFPGFHNSWMFRWSSSGVDVGCRWGIEPAKHQSANLELSEVQTSSDHFPLFSSNYQITIICSSMLICGMNKIYQKWCISYGFIWHIHRFWLSLVENHPKNIPKTSHFTQLWPTSTSRHRPTCQNLRLFIFHGNAGLGMSVELCNYVTKISNCWHN